MRIGAVVVAYRSSGTIRSCLQALAADDAVREVVVFDNSSDATTATVCHELASQGMTLEYVASSNLGFARGCNEGVAHLRDYDLVAFINPDVELHRSLSSLWRLAVGRKPAIVGALLLPPDGLRQPNARPDTTISRELLKAVVGSRAYATHGAPGADGLRPVSQVDGALMLMPRDAYQALGGFDEQFELYYEDVDLCWRAHRHGGVYFASAPWGIHHGGVSSGSAPTFSYCAGRVSRVRYLRKRYTGRSTGAAIGAIAVIEFLTRTIARSSEGAATRWTGLRLQFAEVLRPGSVRLLPPPSGARHGDN